MLTERVSREYPGFPLPPKPQVAVAGFRDVTIYVITGIPCFWESPEGRLLPTIHCLLRLGSEWLPRIIVDQGAVRPVARGADIMIPGIVEVVGEFEEGSVVAVIDEKHRAPIAVGEALLSSSELRDKVRARSKGRAVKNLHRPGDRVWNACRALESRY